MVSLDRWNFYSSLGCLHDIKRTCTNSRTKILPVEVKGMFYLTQDKNLFKKDGQDEEGQ